MNKLLLGLLLAATSARAGTNYNLEQGTSSTTMRVAGRIQVSDPASPYGTTILLDGKTGGVITATTLVGALNGSNLVNGTVTTGKHAADSVTTSAILDASVTTGKLGSGAVTTGKLATDAVASNAILNGAVTMAKLATSGTLPALDGSALINVTGTATPVSTHTFITASGTFTTWTNTRQLHGRCWSGGGGGGSGLGITGAAAQIGGSTVFDVFRATGGAAGGDYNGTVRGSPGISGYASGVFVSSTVIYTQGTSGSGGGAGSSSGTGGAGGWGGSCMEFWINTPSASYNVQIGAGGAGGVTSGNSSGGAGGSGGCIIEGMY